MFNQLDENEKNGQAELERQRDEERRKMEEKSDQLNANQKEALLEKFKLDQVSYPHWLGRVVRHEATSSCVEAFSPSKPSRT